MREIFEKIIEANEALDMLEKIGQLKWNPIDNFDDLITKINLKKEQYASDVDDFYANITVERKDN